MGKKIFVFAASFVLCLNIIVFSFLLVHKDTLVSKPNLDKVSTPRVELLAQLAPSPSRLDIFNTLKVPAVPYGQGLGFEWTKMNLAPNGKSYAASETSAQVFPVNPTAYIVEYKDAPVLEYQQKLLKAQSQTIQKQSAVPNGVPVTIQNQVKSYKAQLGIKQATAFSDLSAKLNISGAQLRSKLKHEFKSVMNGAVLMISASEAAKIRQSSFVKAVYPDAEVKSMLTESVRKIRADEAWRYNTQGSSCMGGETCLTGRGIRIGIVDTGIDYRHADLGGCLGASCKVFGGYNVFTGTADPMDDNGHGTHVAATAAGNGAVFKGVAPEASLYGLKVLTAAGSGSISGVVAGLEYVMDPNKDGIFTDRLVDVINMSLGAVGDPTSPLSTVVDRVSDSGIIVVVAAGNAGKPGSIATPGASRKAITVGAVDKSDIIASFSSRGPTANWGSMKPDVVAPGVDICAAKASSVSFNDENVRPCYDSAHMLANGTSMATPHVAGLAAILRQRFPSYTPDEIKGVLHSSSRRIVGSVYDQGYGRVDAQQAVTAYNRDHILLEPAGRIEGGALPIKGTLAINHGYKEYTVDLGTYNEGLSPNYGWREIARSQAVIPSGGTFTTINSNALDAVSTYMVRVRGHRTDGSYIEDIAMVWPRHIAINFPGRFQELAVGSTYDIVASISIPNFKEFKLRIVETYSSNDLSSKLVKIVPSSYPFSQQVIARLDTTGMPNSSYNLELEVSNTANLKRTIMIPIMIRNTLHSEMVLTEIFDGPRSTFGGLAYFGPVVADIDGNGTHEIVSGHQNEIKVFDHRGNPMPGFPVRTPTLNQSRLVVADIAGDAKKEIIYDYGEFSNAFVNVVDSKGVTLPNFPKGFCKVSLFGGLPSLVPGTKDLVFGADYCGKIFKITKDGVSVIMQLMAGEAPEKIVAGDLGSDGKLDFVVNIDVDRKNRANPLNRTVVFNEQGALVRTLPVNCTSLNIIIADVNADKKNDLICVEFNARTGLFQFHALDSGERELSGWPITWPYNLIPSSLSVGDPAADGKLSLMVQGRVGNKRDPGNSWIFAYGADGSERLKIRSDYRSIGAAVGTFTYGSKLLFPNFSRDTNNLLTYSYPISITMSDKAGNENFTYGLGFSDSNDLNALPVVASFSGGELAQVGMAYLRFLYEPSYIFPEWDRAKYDFVFTILTLPNKYDPKAMDWVHPEHDPLRSGSYLLPAQRPQLPAPDLTVTDVVFEPNPPRPTNELNVIVTVKNVGHAALRDYDSKVKFDVYAGRTATGQPVISRDTSVVPVPPMESGESRNITFGSKGVGGRMQLPLGDYTLVISALHPKDEDMSNDSKTIPLYMSESPIDVAATKVALTPATPKASQDLKVQVDFTNVGITAINDNLISVSLSIRSGTSPDGPIVYSNAASIAQSVPVGGTASYSFGEAPGSPIRLNEGEFTLVARVSHPQDGKSSNNSVSKTISIAGASGAVDLKVRDVYTVPSRPKISENFSIRADLVNEGANPLNDTLTKVKLNVFKGRTPTGQSIYAAEASLTSPLLPKALASVDFGKGAIGSPMNFEAGEYSFIVTLSHPGDQNTANNVIRNWFIVYDPTPRIAYSKGKVNEFMSATDWTWHSDPDNATDKIDKLAYCRKWYPATLRFEPYKNELITYWRTDPAVDPKDTKLYSLTVTSDRCVEHILSASRSANSPATQVITSPAKDIVFSKILIKSLESDITLFGVRVASPLSKSNLSNLRNIRVKSTLSNQPYGAYDAVFRMGKSIVWTDVKFQTPQIIKKGTSIELAILADAPAGLWGDYQIGINDLMVSQVGVPAKYLGFPAYGNTMTVKTP